MRQNALLLEHKPAVPPSTRAHTCRVAVKDHLADAFEHLNFTLRHLLSSLLENMQALNELVARLDSEIAALSLQQTVYLHLLTIPGVGLLIAAAFNRLNLTWVIKYRSNN
nr:hypothetical protein [Klebsiella indica]